MFQSSTDLNVGSGSLRTICMLDVGKNKNIPAIPEQVVASYRKINAGQQFDTLAWNSVRKADIDTNSGNTQIWHIACKNTSIMAYRFDSYKLAVTAPPSVRITNSFHDWLCDSHSIA